MFRSHGTDVPREIYNFGGRGDWAYDAQEKFINLRYRLLPYIYSTAWSVTAEASTMMRALAMDFAGDKKVWDINNQYLFGKSFLVCPVTEALYTGNDGGSTPASFDAIKTHSVYLPEGAGWTDFWTGETLKGGQTISREAPIGIMPLYVKAGSIVPMGPLQQYAGEKKPAELEIRIYEGADGMFTLYEDENDSYNYEKGVYATIPFQWNGQSRELSIGERKGSFPGMLQNRTFNIVLVDKDRGAGAGISSKFNKSIRYSGKAVTVKL
jgi:alpha-D-xyloside xylohydrolase